jgi:hypothetical protein
MRALSLAGEVLDRCSLLCLLAPPALLLLSLAASSSPAGGGERLPRRGDGLTVPLALFGAVDLTPRPAGQYRSARPAADTRFFGMYAASVAVGAQRFNVQLDTGSSTLIVPAADCDGCAAGLRRYRPAHSSSSERLGCGSERCSGYCSPTTCQAARGATCDARDAPPAWALALRTGGSAGVGHPASLCADDALWRGPDGRGCDKYRDPALCGEGESVARCPASCGGCGRCCTADGGCFFEQTYADQTGGTGALFSDRLAVAGLDRAGRGDTAYADGITFGAVSLATSSADAPFAPIGVDGVLGIGYSWLNCHPTCIPAPLDALLAAVGTSVVGGGRGAGGDGGGDGGGGDAVSRSSNGTNIFALCLATPSEAADCINSIHAADHGHGDAGAGSPCYESTEHIPGPETAAASEAESRASSDAPRHDDATYMTYAGAGGSWDLGWVDKTKHIGQLQYLPVLHESYYIVRAPIAARLAPPPPPPADKGNAGLSGDTNKAHAHAGMIRGLSPKMWGLTVFDSGTAHTLVPPDVFAALKPALLSQLELEQKLEEPTSAGEVLLLSRIFDDMCVPAPAGSGFSAERIKQLFPVLQLVFRGTTEAASSLDHGKPFQLSWGPEHYLYSSPHNPFASLVPGGRVNMRDDEPEPEPEPEQWLCSGIIGAGDRTVLGASFLRSFYTVFDRSRKRIGIAPSASNCIPADACKACTKSEAAAAAAGAGAGAGDKVVRAAAAAAGGDGRQYTPLHVRAGLKFAVYSHPTLSVVASALLLCLYWLCGRRCGKVAFAVCGRCCCY